MRLIHAGFVEPKQVTDHDDGWAWYLSRLQARAEGRDPGPDTAADRAAARVEPSRA